MEQQRSTLIVWMTLCLICLWSGKTVASVKFCFKEAGYYYKIDPFLLRSIALVESNLNPGAVGVNNDSKGNVVSRDYGLMQINDRHIPELISRGIISSGKELLENPCTNIKVGAWILYKHFQQCGVNWPCLGTYNAGFSEKNKKRRREYMLRVYTAYIGKK